LLVGRKFTKTKGLRKTFLKVF